MASPIQNLANAMPVRNAQAAAGIKQANDLGVQALANQATGAADKVANVKQASQQVGAAQTAATGQKQVAQAQQQVQQAGQIGSAGLQEQAATAQNALATKKLNLDKEHLTNTNRLAALSRDLKQKLFDDNMTFKRDETGRAFFNDRQLCDWAVTKAKSQEEFKNYQQKVMQAYDRKMQMLEVAHRKILQAIDQASRQNVQIAQYQGNKALYKAKAAMEAKIAELGDKRKAAGQMWGTGLGVVGGVAGGIAGAYAGGPMGAIAGASGGFKIGQQTGQAGGEGGILPGM